MMGFTVLSRMEMLPHYVETQRLEKYISANVPLMYGASAQWKIQLQEQTCTTS
jgi:hypothetical protein